MNTKSCCFIGHRTIIESENLINNIKKLVIDLITHHNVTDFLIGSRSQFNELCHKIVSDLKKEYPQIKRISYTCKSGGCVLEKDRFYFEKLYSEIQNKEVKLFGVEEEFEYKNKYSAGKSSYIERNYAMIDNSHYCIFYYDENYKLNSSNSGTKLAYTYAQRKNKKVYNLFKIVRGSFELPRVVPLQHIKNEYIFFERFRSHGAVRLSCNKD